MTAMMGSARHDYSAGGRLLSVRDRERVGSGAFTLAGQETYLYDGVRGAGPRAATELVSTRGASTSSTTYSYSGGRQTAAGARGVEYTHFDLPVTVTDGVTRTFDYDAQHGRARAHAQGETTLYAGDWFERRAQLQGASEDVIHVYGPSGLLAQLRRGVAASGWTTEYIHTDHLGSATVTTASDGSVVSEQWFGPFGRRLDAQGRDLPRNTGVPEGLRVGFTGHEQEDTLGLVDMRGRYYDPTQRRFLTPDPIIARPLSTQAFSPYAYVDNNPLSRIDPTGFWGESAEENGFMDEGDWDLSGMDSGAGGSGSASGSGMAADYRDDDGGDIDFDPGESMAGQDEQAGNDGTDDWSDSGSSKQARGVEGWFWSREVIENYEEANGRTLLHDVATVAYNEFAIAIHRTRGSRGDTMTAYDMADMAAEIRAEIEAGGRSVQDWEAARARWLRALSGGAPPLVQATARQAASPQLANGTMAFNPLMNHIVVRSDAGAGEFRWTVEGTADLDANRTSISGSVFFQLDHELIHPEHPSWSEERVVQEVNLALQALGLPLRDGYTTRFILDDHVFQWVVPQRVR
jgi:RHS repeat-associated protein